MEIPKINKTYNCFDDGKIRESRKYEVTVIKVIPFGEIDKEILQQWETQIMECYWLYEKETDYFIITSVVDEEDNEDEIFVRTKDNGWFSIGGFLNCGRMDVDGGLTRHLDNIKKGQEQDRLNESLSNVNPDIFPDSLDFSKNNDDLNKI
jgi:hypothetical protein